MLLITDISKPEYVKDNFHLIRKYFDDDAFDSLVKLVDFQIKKSKNNQFQETNQNFTIENIPGDGNCLFRALSQQMNRNQNSYSKYRKEVCDYIENNWNLFTTHLPILLNDMNIQKDVSFQQSLGI